MSDATRDPLSPPFPPGTRLRCIEGHDVHVPRVDRPRDIKDHPTDWVRCSGRGIEVEIDHVKPGHRGTGRQLRDEDGPMYDDNGEPMLDETRDGYSVYYVVRGPGVSERAAKNSGRIIWPDSAHRWELLWEHPVRTYVVFTSSFRGDSAPCISHETVDGVKTLCGRPVSQAATVEPDSNNLDPDCNSCRRAAHKIQKSQAPEAAIGAQ